MSKKGKSSIADSINEWLGEQHGELFKEGKWRFWFPAMFILQTLIAGAMAKLFPEYFWFIILPTAALLLWLCFGFLHYTDTQDKRFNQGVSILDSIALIIAAAHFCFLFWVIGHKLTLEKGMAEYELVRRDYNDRVERDRERNIKIEQLGVLKEQERAKAEREAAKRARAEADAFYWGKTPDRVTPKVLKSVPTPEIGRIGTIESFEKPPSAPEETAQEFFAKWDGWIRLAHFGEFAVALITLIYIRNKSVRSNYEQRGGSYSISGALLPSSSRSVAVGFAGGIPVQKGGEQSNNMEAGNSPKDQRRVGK